MKLDRTAVDGLAGSVVGRRREIEVVIASLGADRHVLLEGPPGTGKSTLLRAVCERLELGFVFVEGNAELTPARLVGHFDPAQVLAEGYTDDIFVDGPLVRALREGSLLYVEEVNRVPEETLNLLVTVMSEGELHVPRLGLIEAAPGFRLVAAMNPFDAVGTARISAAIYDRICRVSMGYQTDVDELMITQGEAGPVDDDFAAKVVDVVRRTREHSDVRIGSSVRGAIDLVKVAASLGELRGLPITDYRVGLDSAFVALSGRIRVQEGSGRTPEEIVGELWRSVFGAQPEDEGDQGKA